MTLTDAITPLLTARIPHLKLEQLDQHENILQATVTSQQPNSKCPTCSTPSSILHSHYRRTVQDLPVGESSMTWTLHVRRFRCRKRSCTQRIFCERFTQGLNAYARNTSRVNALFEKTSVSIGASPASSLIPNFELKASSSTMLRRAHQATTTNTLGTLKIIGIDDFAFQKGHTYGTIIVDHEQGSVVDLLPDRTAKTLVTWLKAHPEIEIITRDRSHEYSKACAEGAPQAKQVFDRFLLMRRHLTGHSRWHVLKNLRDSLEHFLKRNSKQIAEIAKEFKVTSSIPINKGSKKHQERAKTMLEVRRERILRARALFAEHRNIAWVAKALPTSKVFVRKAIRSEGLPDLRDNARATSLLERWVPELEARFVAGLRNAKQFWRELYELGFVGSYKRIHDWVRFRRDQQEAREIAQVTTVSSTAISAPSEQARTRSFTPRQLVWLLLFADTKLNYQDAKILE